MLKADRKRLKAEKFDVLNQMKQLYATLEDKEKELRDFIRTYEKVIFSLHRLAQETLTPGRKSDRTMAVESNKLCSVVIIGLHSKLNGMQPVKVGPLKPCNKPKDTDRLRPPQVDVRIRRV